jgi:hypothetical protein
VTPIYQLLNFSLALNTYTVVITVACMDMLLFSIGTIITEYLRMIKKFIKDPKTDWKSPKNYCIA